MRIGILGCSLLLGTAVVSAQGKKGGAVKAAVLEEGKKVFETNCAACHGPEGKGMARPRRPWSPSRET